MVEEEVPMKKIILMWLTVMVVFVPAAAWAKTPHGVAGFVLGEQLSKYKDMLQMDTVQPVRHFEAVKEVEIKPIKGIKSGIISYGVCASPGKIIRIKITACVTVSKVGGSPTPKICDSPPVPLHPVSAVDSRGNSSGEYGNFLYRLSLIFRR